MGLSNDTVTQIQKGKKPFKILYDEYYVPVFRFVYRRVESVDIAKDVTADAFVLIYQNLNKYRDIGKSFDSWIIKVTHNQILSFYRNSKRKKTIAIDNSDAFQIVDGLDIEKKIINEDFVTSIFNGLTENEKELLIMRFFEERPFKEIAEILEMEEGAVKMKIYRLVKQIKQNVSIISKTQL